MIQYNVHRDNLDAAIAVTPGKRSPCVIPLGNVHSTIKHILVLGYQIDSLIIILLMFMITLTGFVDDSEWVAVSALVAKKETSINMDKLVEIGGQDILLFDLANCRA